MSYKIVYEGVFKQYRLDCKHGHVYLDELPTNPDQLIWGTPVSKNGIIRVDKEWALENPCRIHLMTKIDYEFKRS